MSAKKKNTLKDLDAFLKQEASSLVHPPKIEAITSPATPLPTEAQAPEAETIIALLEQLAAHQGHAFEKSFHQIIIQTLERTGIQSPGHKMLINTALYLSHQDNWKEAIRSYWSK
jgi:hypothetical protein